MEENILPPVNPPRRIPVWRLFVVLLIIIASLLLATIGVCGSNASCRSRVPTLDHLLNSTFASPFIVSALNVVLGLHLSVNAGLYHLTRDKSGAWSRLQVTCALLVYLSVVITLFVFPFTDWPGNWANLTIVVALIAWMVCVILALRGYYRHSLSRKRHLLMWSMGACGLYALSSIVYIVMRALDIQSWLLATEIMAGMAVFTFLILCIAHIWHLHVTVGE